LALYAGESVGGAKLPALTAEPEIVRDFAARLLAEPEVEEDAAASEIERGRWRALKLVCGEAE
jgi:hypothetical protein